MRIKWETWKDGDYIAAAATVKLNRNERKRLEQLLHEHGEIRLCFLTTLTDVEDEIVIIQERELEDDDEREHWRRWLSDLLSMVEEEVDELCWYLDGDEKPDQPQGGLAENEGGV